MRKVILLLGLVLQVIIVAEFNLQMQQNSD